jgi:hypothetical protein
MVKKLTRAEAKRLLMAIQSKTRKLWLTPTSGGNGSGLQGICTTKDMGDIEKVVVRMMNRLG